MVDLDLESWIQLNDQSRLLCSNHPFVYSSARPPSSLSLLSMLLKSTTYFLIAKLMNCKWNGRINKYNWPMHCYYQQQSKWNCCTQLTHTFIIMHSCGIKWNMYCIGKMEIDWKPLHVRNGRMKDSQRNRKPVGNKWHKMLQQFYALQFSAFDLISYLQQRLLTIFHWNTKKRGERQRVQHIGW